jgi:hypothetical protein
MMDPMTDPMMDARMPYTVYPEMYYRMQPYIMMVCDKMDANNMDMPSQEMVERISDSIYDDMRKNPDIAEYMQSQDQAASDGAAPSFASIAVQGPYGYYDYDPYMFRFDRRDFRRRGLSRDLIEILLLSELFRRRRRRYDYYDRY